MKIAAINFGGIGDQILFFPLLEKVKKLYPGSEITMIVEPRSKSAANLTKLIDRIDTANVKDNRGALSKFLELISLLKKDRYDMVISCGSSPLVSVFLFLSGIKRRVGFSTNKVSSMLLTHPAPFNKDQYAGYMFQDLARALGSREEYSIPSVVLPEDADKWAVEWLKQKGIWEQEYILIHPGASALSVQKKIIKAWDVSNWLRLVDTLCGRMGKKVVLAGGPDDREVVEAILPEMKDNPNFICAYGDTRNLEQLGALIKYSSLFLCIDSGPMHIAAGLGVKVAAIFGPTDEKKLLPQDERFCVLSRKMDCRPCLFDKRLQVCENPDCLKVEVEEAAKAVEEMLSLK